MQRVNRRFPIIIVVLLILFAAEFAREKIVYFRDARDLQHAYWKIKAGMTREQVIAELGPPTNSKMNAGAEDLEWSTANYRKFLLRVIGAGHGHDYTITVTLGGDGRVIDVTSENS
jgi:hypothetical protein